MTGRVLLTGSTGFTGRYVTDELESHGWEVWGLGHQPASAAQARYRQVDLADTAGLADAFNTISPAAVIHLAALAHVTDNDAGALYTTNLLGTYNLLDAAARHEGEISAVVLASSANIYGNAHGGLLDESTPPNPANDYAVSKLAMEHMARLWAPRLPIVISRPFNYTGLGQAENFLIPKIVRHFKDRATRIELGNINVERDFSDVRDVAYAYRRLLEEGPVGETVNVCSGRLFSLQHILDRCGQLTGHSLDVIVNPAFVRDNEVRQLFGDPSHLHSLIGSYPRRSMDDTLAWMLGL